MRALARFSISSKLMSSSVTASSLNTTRGMSASCKPRSRSARTASAMSQPHRSPVTSTLPPKNSFFTNSGISSPLSGLASMSGPRKWRVAQPAT